MARPIPQTYTLEMYMKKMKDFDIRSDASVQRMSGQWDKSMINELIYTVLDDNSEEGDGYIPPIILGEEQNSQLWIVDGLQRSTSLALFRYGNYKISSAMDNTIITYKSKKKDENGNIMRNKRGDILREDVEFDLKGKTYDMLPEELKKTFNEYQIGTVIHKNCTMEKIAKFIKKYNNHTSMNTEQKAFTYIENYARQIRNILGNGFFVNCGTYSEKDITRGKMERIVMESVMCINHLDDWKSSSKQLANYLNKNSSDNEFINFNNNLDRLNKIITPDLKKIFNVKDSFIFFTIFNDFTKLGIEDCRFADFLREFNNSLHSKVINGKSFDNIEIDLVTGKKRGTKDTSVIKDKLGLIKTLLEEYLCIGIKETKPKIKSVTKSKNKLDIKLEDISIMDFVKDNVSGDIIEEDISFFEEMLDCLSLNVDNNTKLLDKENHISIIALIAYSIVKEVDLDDWFIDYFKRNDTYLHNKKENFMHMKSDLDNYIDNKISA